MYDSRPVKYEKKIVYWAILGKYAHKQQYANQAVEDKQNSEQLSCMQPAIAMFPLKQLF